MPAAAFGAAAKGLPAEQGGALRPHGAPGLIRNLLGFDRGVQPTRLRQFVERLLDAVENFAADAPLARLEIVVASSGFNAVRSHE